MTEPEQPVVAVPERSTGATEFAWLVERGQSMRQVPTVWWTGERVPNVEQWTTDANKAKKFASREEAETQIEALSGFIRPGTDRFGIAVQHGFISSQPVVAVPLRAALEAIIVRCEEGDNRTNWLPTIADIARAALAVEAVRPETDIDEALDAAWNEAVAALPEGCDLALHKLVLDGWAEAVAGEISVEAESPTAALQVLAERLRGERP